MANPKPIPRKPGKDGKHIFKNIGFPENHIKDLSNKEINHASREAVRQLFLKRIKK